MQIQTAKLFIKFRKWKLGRTEQCLCSFSRKVELFSRDPWSQNWKCIGVNYAQETQKQLNSELLLRVIKVSLEVLHISLWYFGPALDYFSYCWALQVSFTTGHYCRCDVTFSGSRVSSSLWGFFFLLSDPSEYYFWFNLQMPKICQTLGIHSKKRCHSNRSVLF